MARPSVASVSNVVPGEKELCAPVELAIPWRAAIRSYAARVSCPVLVVTALLGGSGRLPQPANCSASHPTLLGRTPRASMPLERRTGRSSAANNQSHQLIGRSTATESPTGSTAAAKSESVCYVAFVDWPTERRLLDESRVPSEKGFVGAPSSRDRVVGRGRWAQSPLLTFSHPP
eukprot:scaffold246895_cov30-Tisochrysis_lutea.AAC.2